jgi:hypothetical protein
MNSKHTASGALAAVGLAAAVALTKRGKRWLREDKKNLEDRLLTIPNAYFVEKQTYRLFWNNCTEVLAHLFPSRHYECRPKLFPIAVPIYCKRAGSAVPQDLLKLSEDVVARVSLSSLTQLRNVEVDDWCNGKPLPKEIHPLECDIVGWLEKARTLPEEDRLIIVAAIGGSTSFKLISHVTVIFYDEDADETCTFGVNAGSRGLQQPLLSWFGYEIPFHMASPDRAIMAGGPACFVQIIDAFRPSDAELTEIEERLKSFKHLQKGTNVGSGLPRVTKLASPATAEA